MEDGSATLVLLKDTKEAYPVQLAEYSVASQIASEPAFVLWVPFTLKKRNRIIAKMKSKYWVRTHNLGLRSQRPCRRQRLSTQRMVTPFGGMPYVKK